MRRLIIPAIVFAISCTKDRTVADSTAVNTAPPPASTVATAISDNGCPVDSSGRHREPVQLVREWAARDNRGGTLATSQWYLGALACVETATSDMIYITSPITVTQIVSLPDTALVLQTYHRFYAVRYDSTGAIMQLSPDSVAVAETTRVVRLPRLGWRIETIAGGAHLLPQVALDSLTHLDSASVTELRKLASRPDV